MMNRIAASTAWLLTVAAVLAGGCQRALLTTSDTFMSPGMSSMLDARLERSAGAGEQAGLAGVPVAFFVHEQRLGEALTDDMGVARLMCDLPDGATHYRAEARLHGGGPLLAEGLVFNFPRGRTVIVCDIDETISMTHYRELVFDEADMASRPFPGAARTLTNLNQRFGLVYLTARPGFLLEKTKRWLAENGFPSAPVVTTPGLAQSIAVQKYKARRIEQLKSVLGTVGIGIGNAHTDSEAYAMQHLLTLIIDDSDDNKFRSHAIVLRDWNMVDRFFAENAALLEDYARLQSAIDGNEFIRRPIIHYQRRR